MRFESYLIYWKSLHALTMICIYTNRSAVVKRIALPLVQSYCKQGHWSSLAITLLDSSHMNFCLAFNETVSCVFDTLPV